MVTANRLSYLQSLAQELAVQAKRVRDLIGPVHWVSDGSHKESLFRSLLERHLPSGLVASRGFVVGHTNEALCSKEQDVLIVDTGTEAPLFNQGDLVIAFPHQVRAIVSIKTEVSGEMVTDAIQGLASVFGADFPQAVPRPWVGVFFFEPRSCKPQTLAKYLKDGLKASHEMPKVPPDWIIDAVTCNDNFIALRRTHSKSDGSSIPLLRGYAGEGLSTAIFLGHLLDHLSSSQPHGESTFLSAMDDVQLAQESKFDAEFENA